MSETHLEKFVMLKPRTERRLFSDFEAKDDVKCPSKDSAGKMQVLAKVGTRGKAGKGGRVMDLPPTLDVTPKLSHVFRFYATSSGNVSCPANRVLASMGFITTVANTTCQPWTSSFRVKKVVIWDAPNSSVAPVCFIYWNLATGTQIRDEEKNQILPEGVTVSKSIVSRPPKGSLAAMWQTTSSLNLFTVSANTGSVLDLHVDFTLSNQFVSSAQSIGATSPVGSINYGWLDATSGGVWVPVGLPHL
jgi:hypothetical protein